MIRLCEQNVIELLCEELDSTYDKCTVGNYTFLASTMLKELDPIAFRCELLNYASEHNIVIDDDLPYIVNMGELI